MKTANGFSQLPDAPLNENELSGTIVKEAKA